MRKFIEKLIITVLCLIYVAIVIGWICAVSYVAAIAGQWFVNSFMNPSEPITLKLCLIFIGLCWAMVGAVGFGVVLDNKMVMRRSAK